MHMGSRSCAPQNARASTDGKFLMNQPSRQSEGCGMSSLKTLGKLQLGRFFLQMSLTQRTPPTRLYALLCLSDCLFCTSCYLLSLSLFMQSYLIVFYTLLPFFGNQPCSHSLSIGFQYCALPLVSWCKSWPQSPRWFSCYFSFGACAFLSAPSVPSCSHASKVPWQLEATSLACMACPMARPGHILPATQSAAESSSSTAAVESCWKPRPLLSKGGNHCAHSPLRAFLQQLVTATECHH